MKRQKRDPQKRVYNSGYRAGIKGHSKDDCRFTDVQKRSQWLGGWHDGRVDHLCGYSGASTEP